MTQSVVMPAIYDGQRGAWGGKLAMMDQSITPAEERIMKGRLRNRPVAAGNSGHLDMGGPSGGHPSEDDLSPRPPLLSIQISL